MTLPLLRDAAVRVQADLLAIFRVQSHLFEQVYIFSQNIVKGYATCEVAPLDTRTGIMPYTDVLSRRLEQGKEDRQQDGTDLLA